MKKLILAAVLFIAVDASAQDRRMDHRGGKDFHPEFFQKKNDFKGKKITPQQKRQIDALAKLRLSPREYDARVRAILSNGHYADNLKPHHKDPRMDIPGPFRR